MYIFRKSIRVRECFVLCIGFVCLIGCQGGYVRDVNISKKIVNEDATKNETGKIEAKRDLTKTSKPVVKGPASTNTNVAVRNEESNVDTYIEETVDKKNDLGSGNISVEPPVDKANIRIDNNIKTVPFDETGNASFISDEYVGRMTASGVRYDREKMTAAHPTLPFDTRVLVTNLRNKRMVEVIIIDRFTPTNDRILNVSHSAALELDLVESGVAKIGIRIISNPDGN